MCNRVLTAVPISHPLTKFNRILTDFGYLFLSIFYFETELFRFRLFIPFSFLCAKEVCDQKHFFF